MEKNQLSCGAALSIIGVLVLLGIFFWQYPEKPSDWPAWVQAFGSISAIAAAVSISKRQWDKQKEDNEAVVRSKLVGSLSLLGEAVASLNHTAGLLRLLNLAKAIEIPVNHQRSVIASMKTLSRSIKSVEKIPFHEYPYSDIHHALNPVLSGLYDADAVMETLIEQIQGLPPIRIDEFLLSRFEDTSKSVADEYKDLRSLGNIIIHISQISRWRPGRCRSFSLSRGAPCGRVSCRIALVAGSVLPTAEHLHLVGHNFSAVPVSPGVFVLVLAGLDAALNVDRATFL